MADEALRATLIRDLETIAEKLPAEVTGGHDWIAPVQRGPDLLAAARALTLGRLRDRRQDADPEPESGA